MAKKVFISYRRADTEAIAGRLRDRLLTRLPGSHVFFDTGSIEAGERFAERIAAAAKQFDVMVVMIGAAWLGPARTDGAPTRIWQDDDYVRLEVRTGLDRGAKMTMLPVLVEHAPVPDRAELPPDLHELLAHNMMRLSNASFDRDFDILFARTQGRTSTPPTRSRPARLVVATLAGAALACLAALVVGIVHMAALQRSLAESLGGNTVVEALLVVLVVTGAAVGYRLGARR